MVMFAVTFTWFNLYALIRFAVKLDFNLAIILIFGADQSRISVIIFAVDI
jgi:hypothetical protein